LLPIFLVVVVIAVLSAGYAARQSRIRRLRLSLKAAGLEPEWDATGFVGSWRGLDFRYELTSGGRGKQHATSFAIALPADLPPLEMELRPQTRIELVHLEHGRAIDVELGDDQFDDAFIVEVAPAELARELLEPRARSTLLGLSPCRVTVSNGRLVLQKNGYLEEPGEVKRVVEICTDLASRLGTMKARLAEKQLEASREDPSAGYRGASPDAVRALAAVPRGAEEIAAVREAREKRSAYQVKVGGAVLAAAGAIAVIAAILRDCH
jgi:hypothetical protein